VATTQPSPKSTNATERKCPVCKRELADRSEYEATTKELERRVSERHLELSKKQKRDFESALRGMKADHRREMQTLRKNLKNQQILLKKRSDGQFRKEKDSFEKKAREMKKNNQLALQDTRDVYEKQNLIAQKEQEKAVNNQLKEIMQTYSGLASSYQKEIEKVRKMQEVHEGIVRRKESEVARLKIELAKSNTDLQIRRLVLQLGERNASIEQLQRRIRELESMMASIYSPQTQTSTLDEREQETSKTVEGHLEKGDSDAGMSQKQRALRDEFMTAIKEITREHKRAHEDNINSSGRTAAGNDSGKDDPSMAEGKDSHSDNSSKMSKMRSWFL